MHKVKKIKDNEVYENKYYDKFKTLMDLKNKGDVVFVVLSTVFNEVNFSQTNKCFIRKHCVRPCVNEADYIKIARKIDFVANDYCTFVDEELGIKEPPMQKAYFAHTGTIAPTNDAYIMAEASVYGLSLLTCNSKDFIRSKTQKANGVSWENMKNDRVFGIVMVNKWNRLKFQSRVVGDSRIAVARPYHITTFVGLMNDLDNFKAPKPAIAKNGDIDFNDLNLSL